MDPSCNLPATSPKYVFVTSTTYDGNIGGLSSADNACQARATAAGLPGTYKAWLSDSATSATSRLAHPSVPYKLVDGTLIANSWTDLTDGDLQNPINKTETGASLNTYVWTNTKTNGDIDSTAFHCLNWTSNVSNLFSYGGFSSWADIHWTQYYQPFCNQRNSFFCLQQ